LIVFCLVLPLGSLTTSTVQAGHYYRANIVDVVLSVNKRYGEFDALIAALLKADLLDAVRDGNVTVFAPTDRAFAKAGLGLDVINGLETEEEIEFLRNVLLYHVTEGRVSFYDLKKIDNLLMLNGDFTKIRGWRKHRVFINDAKILCGIPASNGNLFFINEVLTPPVGEPQ
jgi:uncharacterized surface protein with fasciclin (FAS1) repeats